MLKIFGYGVSLQNFIESNEKRSDLLVVVKVGKGYFWAVSEQLDAL